MSETYIETVIRQTAEQHGLTPEDLLQTRAKRSVVLARDEAIKRVRAETQLSMPTIAKIFGVTTSSVWDALRSERGKKREKIDNADEKIVEMWPDHDLHEIAAVVNMSAEGVRSAGKRLGLGRPFRHVTTPHAGHRAFTERCAEILRQHGVLL